MSESTVPKIYVHLSRGRIVETRLETAEPPQWDDDMSDWTLYVPMAQIEQLKSQADYHFETQRTDYNKMEDLLVEREDLQAENKRLKGNYDSMFAKVVGAGERQLKLEAENERLNARLKVLQDAFATGELELWPKTEQKAESLFQALDKEVES